MTYRTEEEILMTYRDDSMFPETKRIVFTAGQALAAMREFADQESKKRIFAFAKWKDFMQIQSIHLSPYSNRQWNVTHHDKVQSFSNDELWQLFKDSPFHDNFNLLEQS